MKTMISRYLLLLLLVLGSLSQAMADDTPVELLQSTSRNMIDDLNQHKSQLGKNPLIVNQMVEKHLLPHIDFITASRWVLGKHWRRASKQQKLQFIREFRSLLVRFYSAALADFTQSHELDHDMITFLPMRNNEEEKDVTIRSIVHSPSGKQVPVNYSMHKTSKGWKVYDVSVEGVSIITTYRTSFANEIKQQGVDGLIASLAAKNKSYN